MNPRLIRSTILVIKRMNTNDFSTMVYIGKLIVIRK